MFFFYSILLSLDIYFSSLELGIIVPYIAFNKRIKLVFFLSIQAHLPVIKSSLFVVCFPMYVQRVLVLYVR